jgi:uncharacterized protein (DUF1330 family)
MSAYVIAHLTVTSPEGFMDYSSQVPATIAQHGGEYLVRGGHTTVLEGEMPHARHVVLRFPDRATAERWYNSPEYQDIISIRFAHCNAVVIIVDGYDA